MDRQDVMSALLIAFFILLSAFFSAAESAFTSLNLVKIQAEAEAGDRRSALVWKLRQDFDRLLSGILIGNNIVNIGASALATVLFMNLFPTYGGVLSTGIMTLLILIFSEISPKSIATQRAEALAKSFAPALNVLVIVLSPIIWLLGIVTDFIVSFFRSDAQEEVSDEELLSLVDQAEETGNLSDYERELIRSAIAFDDLEAEDVLIPRVDMTGFDIADDLEDVQKIFYSNNHSRLIVYDESIDHVLGTIHEKTFSRYMLGMIKAHTIRDLIMDVIYVPPTTRISDLLTVMQGTHLHVAIIKDEYGGTVGMVTMEDVLEALVGEIWDEGDVKREEIVQMKDGAYEIAAEMNLHNFFETFEIVPDREFESNRVSGFFLELLDRMPQVGDSVTYGGVRLTVNHMLEDRIVSFVLQKDSATSADDDGASGDGATAEVPHSEK